MRRRDHRLVRAALGAERDARRRADEDRLAAGVDPERPRLERARDERVVDRPDRQQRLAVARPGGAELAQRADEVDLGDPELDVAAVVVLAPAHQRVGVVGEPVDPVADAPDARLVDPAAEVGGGADVGRDRDDALGDVRAPRGRGRRRSGRTPSGSRTCRGACGRGRPAPWVRGRRAWRRASAARPVARTARPRASPARAGRTGPRGPRRASPPAPGTASGSAAPSGWRGGPRSAATSP